MTLPLGPDGTTLRTTCIVTTTPNGVTSPIHDRMPSILLPEDEAAWLDISRVKGQDVLGLLRPYADEELEAHIVSTCVNSLTKDDPSCMAFLLL